jgi:hypothetical protein
MFDDFRFSLKSAYHSALAETKDSRKMHIFQSAHGYLFKIPENQHKVCVDSIKSFLKREIRS